MNNIRNSLGHVLFGNRCVCVCIRCYIRWERFISWASRVIKAMVVVRVYGCVRAIVNMCSCAVSCIAPMPNCFRMNLHFVRCYLGELLLRTWWCSITQHYIILPSHWEFADGFRLARTRGVRRQWRRQWQRRRSRDCHKCMLHSQSGMVEMRKGNFAMCWTKMMIDWIFGWWC